VELMGKEKGYNSSHVCCQAKGWSKKIEENLKWYDGGGENEITSKRIFELKCFSPLKI
jgi:hypothetical protein